MKAALALVVGLLLVGAMAGLIERFARWLASKWRVILVALGALAVAGWTGPRPLSFTEPADLQLAFAYQRGEVVMYCARSVETEDATVVGHLTLPQPAEQAMGLLCEQGADTLVRTVGRGERCEFGAIETATFQRGIERLRVLYCGDRYAALKKVPRPAGVSAS